MAVCFPFSALFTESVVQTFFILFIVTIGGEEHRNHLTKPTILTEGKPPQLQPQLEFR